MYKRLLGRLLHTSCHLDSSVKERLQNDNPDQVEVFQKNVQAFVKKVLGEFKEYQFYCGKSCISDIVLVSVQVCLLASTNLTAGVSFGAFIRCPLVQTLILKL